MKFIMLHSRRLFFALLVPVTLLVLCPLTEVKAQFYDGYQMDFGRSRVQFEQFLWTYYKFDRFDIYFYLNGKELAVHTAKYATNELIRLEDTLQTYLEGKIQFVIFNNLNDLKQSNIGLSGEEEYNIGGITHILGNKVVLYFDGSLVNFEKQIRQGIIHVLLQNAIFGSNIGSQLVNSLLQDFPDWYTLGIISYLAEEWNTDIDNRIRNIILSGKYKKFSHLVAEEKYVKEAGHSFWKFIADKYGKASVINIINMTRVSRSIETGFQYVTSSNLKTLFQEWRTHYTSYYSYTDSLCSRPSEEMKLTGKKVLHRNDVSRKYSELKISPDGNYAAFVTNEEGKYKLWLHGLYSGKIRKILSKGYKLDEKVDYDYPITAWHPSGKILTVIYEHKGLIWLCFYDLDTKEWTKQNIFGFEKIRSFSYSDDGKTLVLSAVQKGQSDLFLFRISSGSYEQVTMDVFDDFDPHFIENSNKVIFSSNRTSDTLKFGFNDLPEVLNEKNDIFILDLKSKKSLLRRVTNTPFAGENKPMEYSKGFITFLSDENGIRNQYIGKLDSTVAYVDTTVHYRYFTKSFALTNYSRNIEDHHVSVESHKYAWIQHENLYDRLYSTDMTPARETEAEQLFDTPFMNSLTSSRFKKPAVVEPAVSDTTIETGEQTPKPGRQRKSFRNAMKGEVANPAAEVSQETTPGDKGSKSNQFAKQGIIGINMPDSLNAMPGRFTAKKPDKKEKKDEFVIPKQRNYYTEYSLNKLVTQVFDFSYLNKTYQPYSGNMNGYGGSDNALAGISPGYSNPGMSPTLKAAITDLMEDHRMIGGIGIGLDFDNLEYFLSYADFKKRLDKEYIYQRRTISQPVVSDSLFMTRNFVNEGFAVYTWPFNRVLKLAGTFLFRNENYVFAERDVTNRIPDRKYNWTGGKLQFIYDDTKSLGLNLLNGTRFMVFGEYNVQIEHLNKNLMVFGFDFRHYKKIHRQIIWANRLAGSTNFGSERLLYYMGGTNNWLFPSFALETRIDNTQNWAYQTLATNMRGFNQNARNGNNFVVFNTEVRVPVFRYLLNRPIESEFIKNFQLVSFADVGTAWAGWNPYDENNVLYTRYVNSGPVRVIVHYEKDPLIGGFGFGTRTKLLGYFVKGDLAWGVEDGRVNPSPKFYFSMSLDF